MPRFPGPGSACGCSRVRRVVAARSAHAEARSRSRRPTQVRLYESDKPSPGAVSSKEEGAMATTTHVPVEVYLRSSYEPDAEYVDGKIEERPMGEFDHAAWQLAILKWFLQHEKEWNIRVLPELRVRVAVTRYRVPYVTGLDRSRP